MVAVGVVGNAQTTRTGDVKITTLILAIVAVDAIVNTYVIIVVAKDTRVGTVLTVPLEGDSVLQKRIINKSSCYTSSAFSCQLHTVLCSI